MHSNSLAKHFWHIIHPTVLLPGPDILLLVSNWSQNFYQCETQEFNLHESNEILKILYVELPVSGMYG
jgi:hypothetical protein